MRVQNAVRMILLILVSFLEWFILELSCGLNENIFMMESKYILLNVCLIISINLVILLVVNQLYITCLISTILFTLIGIINYFVIIYHASPFTIGELSNLKTALTVKNAYSFDLSQLPIKLIMALIILIIINLVSFIFRNKIIVNRRQEKWKYILLMVCVLYCSVGFTGNNPIKPKKTIGWSWEEAYRKYGYLSCLLEDTCSRFNIINVPDNYSIDDVEQVYNEYINESKDMGTRYPDIIFIVNESLFDLKAISDFETDIDCFENINSMEGLIQGYAVCPTPGGGTACSEYELLTSNSLYLLKAGVIPFNVMDLKNSESIVSYLKSLGYETLGTHIGSPATYNRKTGYSDIGFDEIKFYDDYEDIDYLGRWFASDISVYKNIEKWYEEMSDAPRFIYCLSVQNHGDWEQTVPDYDKVHVIDNSFDDEKKKSIVEEYLTCVSLSDEAFKDLTNYYANCDREVIICMVGDHSPYFAKELMDTPIDDEAKIRLRGTPFFTWANFDIENSDIGYISMPFVVPTLLEIAGMPMSPYYNYLLDLSKQVPIIISSDEYMDYNNQIKRMGEDGYSDIIHKYFEVEYDKLTNAQRSKEFYRNNG